MESPASDTLPCVQRNTAQFSDTQKDSERVLRHSESHQQLFTVLKSSGIKMRFPFLTKTGLFQ